MFNIFGRLDDGFQDLPADVQSLVTVALVLLAGVVYIQFVLLLGLLGLALLVLRQQNGIDGTMSVLPKLMTIMNRSRLDFTGPLFSNVRVGDFNQYEPVPSVYDIQSTSRR